MAGKGWDRSRIVIPGAFMGGADAKRRDGCAGVGKVMTRKRVVSA